MKRCLIILIILAIMQFYATASFGITAEALKEMMERNEKATIIDIRNNVDFTRVHIQGAINIPAKICSNKRLPRLGQVIVYGDDIDIGLTMEAIECLNNKSGITAEMLEGGIGRWDALNYPTIKGNGFTKDENIYISYQQLVDIIKNNHDLVLVDLRSSDNFQAGNQKDNTGSKEELTDISVEFPGVRIKTLPFEKGITEESTKGVSVSQLKGKGLEHADLYVLIDRLNGVAEDMAKRFKKSGIKRFVILAGGEEMLVRKGKPGIEKR